MNTHRTRQFGKPRLLMIGCGDVGMRLLPHLTRRYRVFALVRRPEHAMAVRALGAVPVQGDLDQPDSLRRLGGLAKRIMHLAPPPGEGKVDQRTRNLAAILPDRATLVYVSTSGVYGDCGGARIDETRPLRPQNPRALRRVDAEQALRRWAVRSNSRLAILRAPGIYAAGRLPLERLRSGTPALAQSDDVYTNHIHADDLALLVLRALQRGASNRVYHASDDSDLAMGAYFDLVADKFGLPRPPRLPRAELAAQVSPMLLSFMSESRRMDNRRIKAELGYRLRHPTVAAFLAAPLAIL